MPSIVASALLVLTFVIMPSPVYAQHATDNDKYAPLPEKVVKAKTVFYVNDTGNSRFGDDLYRELKKWNRWEVVTERSKADLVLVLSQRVIPNVHEEFDFAKMERNMLQVQSETFADVSELKFDFGQ